MNNKDLYTGPKLVIAVRNGRQVTIRANKLTTKKNLVNRYGVGVLGYEPAEKRKKK